MSDEIVYTTGQVAKLCKVAPKTVGKWFDSGQLRGYRIPGGTDRRVPREDLVEFLTSAGMPLPTELGGGQGTRPVVAALCCQPRLLKELAEQLWGHDVRPCATGFDLGLACARPPRVLLLDLASGYADSMAALTYASTLTAPPLTIVLCRDDRPDDRDRVLAAGASLALASSVAPAILAGFILGRKEVPAC